jgi:very-short-patch-repair endonuclease
MKRKIIPYNPELKEKAGSLRNDSTTSEIKLWQFLKTNRCLVMIFIGKNLWVIA